MDKPFIFRKFLIVFPELLCVILIYLHVYQRGVINLFAQNLSFIFEQICFRFPQLFWHLITKSAHYTINYDHLKLVLGARVTSLYAKVYLYDFVKKQRDIFQIW